MLFQIVQPFHADIYGDTFKEAIKNYIKINHNFNITNLIIKDQQTHYKTKLKYYRENNKRKVGIDVYPHVNAYGMPISYPTLSPYPALSQYPALSPYPVLAPGPIIQTNKPITFIPSPIIQSPIIQSPFNYLY